MSEIAIDAARRKSRISRNLYGHFSEHLGRCIYGGVYVGPGSKIPNENGIRKDVVAALRNIRVPVLRWPGGCFADEYHWKDGIGPVEKRKKMVNTNWGGVTEDNSFGTHEFMELCRQVGCQPYVNGNLGSGTVQEMSEWVEYMNFDGVSPMTQLRRENGRESPWGVRYFGIGNENWGGGGNMRPPYYADLFRRYQTFTRDYGENKLFRIACGPNADDYGWTDAVMAAAAPYMDALTLHYYTVPGREWSHKGSATAFTEEEYYTTLKKALRMEELIANHTQVMNRYDPQHRVGLIVDEWGAWYDVEPGTNPGFLYQQNTMRDALVAALTLNIFNRHSDRVVMANLAQMVNVLQAVLLTQGEKMLLTPTYHVFDLYQVHQDATLVDSYVQSPQAGNAGETFPQVSASASVDAQGVLHITATNASPAACEPVECRVLHHGFSGAAGRVLAGAMDAHNTFDAPDAVRPVPLEGIEARGETLAFTLPACSVAEISVQ